jgi:hypothetical protein
MTHWVYILSAVGSSVLLAAWRYAPRAFLMVVGGLTKDPQRSKQCAEMLRLHHKDAKDISSYLIDSPGNSKPLASETLPARKRRRSGGSQPLGGASGRVAS